MQGKGLVKRKRSPYISRKSSFIRESVYLPSLEEGGKEFISTMEWKKGSFPCLIHEGGAPSMEKKREGRILRSRPKENQSFTSS